MQGRLSSGTTATQEQFIWHPEPCSHCRLVKMVFCATQVFTCGSHNGGWLVGRWSWSICSWINTTLATLKFRVGKNYGTSRGNWSLVSTVQRIENRDACFYWETLLLHVVKWFPPPKAPKHHQEMYRLGPFNSWFFMPGVKPNPTTEDCPLTFFLHWVVPLEEVVRRSGWKKGLGKLIR